MLIDELACILGCKVAHLPLKYLGLLLSVFQTKINFRWNSKEVGKTKENGENARQDGRRFTKQREQGLPLSRVCFLVSHLLYVSISFSH